MKIKDNFLPEVAFEKIFKLMTSSMFPWYYQISQTVDKKEKDKARDKARKRREDRDKAAGKKRVADYKANKDSVRGQGGRAKGGLMKKDYP